jgi:3-methyladenine DNA glycosylase AlkD
MEPRFGIVVSKAFGVPMSEIQAMARELGRDHDLAEALWSTGVYEARLLAAMVDDPKRVTSAQMDRWAREFESWADCDTVCFKLFDQSPHAFAKIRKWSRSRSELVKRAAFALAASVALHRKDAPDDELLEVLPLIEEAARDDRNFVNKGVSWALRAIGSRKSARVRAAAREVAERLAGSESAAARRVGKEARRQLAKKG